MKYLVVGLGNPGDEYAKTRHNAGFMAVDSLAESLKTTFSTDRYGDVARARLRGHELVLLKPNTFMNESGKAVRYWLSQLKGELQTLLVIVDDLALPAGSLRLRAKGSAGSHNGLKDIEQKLQSSDYARLRIGIGDNYRRGEQVKYVLEPLSADALAEITSCFPTMRQAVELFVLQGVERAMNTVNRAHIGAELKGESGSENR